MDSRFTLKNTSINGLCVIEKKPIQDDRGSLTREYCQSEFDPILGNNTIEQINTVYTKMKGTVRGMHFQHPPHSEAKIVICTHGSILDTVIDIRYGSPTFLQSYSITIDAHEHISLFIPEGFAHGYQTLTDNCQIMYLHTQSYKKEYEDALNHADPALDISWPLTVSSISERDNNHPYIDENFKGIKT